MFKNILVPINIHNEERSKFILDRATFIAQKFSSDLHLIYVLPYVLNKMIDDFFPKNWIKNRLEVSNKKITEIAKKYIPADVPVNTLISKGSLYEEVINCAQKVNADLIILSETSPIEDKELEYDTSNIINNRNVSVILLK